VLKDKSVENLLLERGRDED